jgi:hypothetical protein
MTKEKYFKLVKKINKKLRKKGYEWHKTYSEPRKGDTYRTKLFYCDDEVTTMVKYINKKFGDKVVAETLYCKNGPKMYWSSNVVYKPIKKGK